MNVQQRMPNRNGMSRRLASAVDANLTDFVLVS
jgi:hypothetical protein